jgi:PGF-CTERM protein
MRRWKAPVALVLIISFFIPPAAQAFTAESAPAPAAGRGEYVQPGVFNTSLTSMVNGLYINSSFKVELPGNSTITAASVDFEGRPIMGPKQSLTADFASDPGNSYAAYSGSHSKSTPESTKPSSFVGNQFQNQDLTAIAYSDNRYAYVTYVYNSNEWGYHHFQFKIPMDIVTKVSVTYEGWGGYPWGYYGVGTVAAYLWNNVTGSWENFGSGSDSPKSSFNKDFTDPTGLKYVRGSGANRYIDVLAMCPQGSPQLPYYTCVNTDYVKVYVEGNVLTYPKNPKLYIGKAYTPGWSLQADKFDYQVNVGEAGFMNQIQDVTRGIQGQYASVVFNFKSETIGCIFISNLRISYISPPWCKGIPDTFTLDEDTPNPKLIDLTQYFIDDIAASKLNYEIIYEEDSKKLDAEISSDGGWMGFKMPTKNWWGQLRFQVRATDSDSLQRDSNKFTVSVLPVNDPPVIAPIGRQMATQGVEYQFTVRVRDVDTDLDPEETIMFSDNTSLFEIDQVSGKITFTPSQEQVGVYNIAIIATDMAGATDQENFTLEVLDAEDPPVLDDIQDQTATQDTPFSYTVTASDPDLPYGDSLTFSDDCPLFSINATSGEIGFTPTVKDIGSRKVTITVTDSHGGVDSRQFTLSVLNQMGTMNRPPSIDPIPNQTAQEGTLFEYVAKGSDPDLDQGDSMSFQDNCPVFDIVSGTGKISFKPTAKDAGVYNVKITVKDREGLTAFTEFKLTVIKLNHAPNITSVLPKDGSKVLAGRQFKLSAVATDIDGDRLNYTWKDGDNVLGYGANITMSYPDPGTYIITLIVSDGKLEKGSELTIEVVEKGSGGSSSTPGFEALFAVAAAGIAALVLARRRTR